MAEERKTITAGQLYGRIQAEMEAAPDRRPVAQRLADLGDPHLCLRPGASDVTQTDVDAVELMVRFLHAARRAEEPPAGAFTCPRCGMTSHSPDDLHEGYCGNCHDWTGEHRG